MPLDLKLTFPKTSPRPKAEVIARVGDVSRELSQLPVWMLGENTRGLVGCSLSKKAGAPPELTRNYLTGFSNFSRERVMSSKVAVMPWFAVPSSLIEPPIGVFQLFSKTKSRADVRNVWEFLMLDLWSHVLRHYSMVSKINLKAPQSFKIDGESLTMAFELGTIGKFLAQDYKSRHLVDLPQGKTPLYIAFALHLGALAAVKEAEELHHGDYRLRHVLFDPGEQLQSFFYFLQAWNTFLKRPLTEVKVHVTPPSLSLVDIEHGLRAPVAQVREENEGLLVQARNYAGGNGTRPADFERSYRDGYDMITPESVTQRFVDAQHLRWGFSVDNLF